MKKKNKREREADQRAEFFRIIDKGSVWLCTATETEDPDSIQMGPPRLSVVKEIYDRDGKYAGALVEYEHTEFGSAEEWAERYNGLTEGLRNMFSSKEDYVHRMTHRQAHVTPNSLELKFIHEEEIDAWIAYRNHLQQVHDGLVEYARDVNRMRQDADLRVREIERADHEG